MSRNPGLITDWARTGNGAGTFSDAEQVQQQTADTRASMGHTLDTIHDQLKPRNIVNHSMAVNDKTVKRVRSLSDTATSTALTAAAKNRAPREQMMRLAQRSPAGAVLIGAAAGWLLIRALSVRTENYY